MKQVPKYGDKNFDNTPTSNSSSVNDSKFTDKWVFLSAYVDAMFVFGTNINVIKSTEIFCTLYLKWKVWVKLMWF